ncbi:unnamed protein product [Calypogeia fissa]
MEPGESNEQNPARGANVFPEDWAWHGVLSSSSSNDPHMEEDHVDMEEHEDVDSKRQQQLRPQLWKNVPRKALQNIFRRVLADLPFSRILSFCGAFQPWTDKILSMHFILYSHMHLCMICNPRTGLWESEISSELGFSLAPEKEELQSPDKISQQEFCDRGHLLLSSGVFTEEYFVLFNLLTGRYKRFSSSEIHARRPNFYDSDVLGSTTPSCPKIISAMTISEVAYRLVLFPSPSDYLLVVQSGFYDSGSVISVGKQHIDSKQAICVTDLRSSETWICDEHPEDFSVLFRPSFLLSPGTLVLGFGTCPVGGYRVLTYDVGRKACAWTDWHADAIRSFPIGTTIANVSGDHHEVQFFEVRETRRGRRILAPSPFQPLTRGQRSQNENGSGAQANNTNCTASSPSEIVLARLRKIVSCHERFRRDSVPRKSIETGLLTREAKPRGDPRESECESTWKTPQDRKPSEFCTIVRLEDGDFVYHVGILKRSTSEQLEVSVRKQNRVDGSDHISKWKEWRPLAQESGDLWPTARHFCIFKPSLKWPYE